MSRDREHDKWIPWYVEDTQGWLELSLLARGAMAELARKFNTKGELYLKRGFSELAFLLRLDLSTEVEPALAELVTKGKVTWDAERCVLSDPDYTFRKRRSSADRMADKRARDREAKRDASDVTPVTVTHVTPVLVSSVLVSSDLSLGSDARDPATKVLGLDGECGAAWEAWRQGVSAATGRPVTALRQSDRADLVALANAHAGGLRGEALMGWITTTAKAFVEANEARYGFTPRRCAVWLDGGGKNARGSPVPRQEIGSAASAPWMNPKENFDFGASK